MNLSGSEIKPSSSQTSLIQVSDASKFYTLGETRVEALRNVSLEFTKGDIVALMGPSGSGKSTLLNLIGALDVPDRGEILVLGQNLSRLNRNEQAAFRNATIGFVFQNFNLVPVLTTLENVLLPAQLGRRPLSESLKTRALGLLEKVGLSKQANQSVNRLSGGQMQRVAIARALMNGPSILLADEPTANLDHETASTVLKVMRELSLSEGATVIIATHDQAVLGFCHRIVRLHDGSLMSDERRV